MDCFVVVLNICVLVTTEVCVCGVESLKTYLKKKKLAFTRFCLEPVLCCLQYVTYRWH